MFKLNPAPEFTVSCPLSVPGLPQPLELKVCFRYKNKSALAAWLQGASGVQNAVFLDQVISSWSGLFDDAGQAVPYSLTALTALLENYQSAFGELFDTYLKELTESKRKNS